MGISSETLQINLVCLVVPFMIGGRQLKMERPLQSWCISCLRYLLIFLLLHQVYCLWVEETHENRSYLLCVERGNLGYGHKNKRE